MTEILQDPLRRGMLILAALLTAVMLPAQAQAADDPLPQLYDVTGVRSDDTLNVRAGPGTQHPVVGTLAPDATSVEVVARDDSGRWGMVNTGERSGWASLHFMQARGVHIDNYNLPVGMRCFGTEPFWALTHDGSGQLALQEPEGDARMFDLDIAQDSGIAGDLRRMLLARGSSGALTAYIHPETCSDGMSDMLYGLALGLMPAADGPLLTGCCSLAPR